jgi:hypothetical protein
MMARFDGPLELSMPSHCSIRLEDLQSSDSPSGLKHHRVHRRRDELACFGRSVTEARQRGLIKQCPWMEGGCIILRVGGADRVAVPAYVAIHHDRKVICDILNTTLSMFAILIARVLRLPLHMIAGWYWAPQIAPASLRKVSSTHWTF